MHKTNKSSSLLSKYFYLIPISIVFLFLLILNILFPSQSDDMGYRELGGFSAAIDSYLHKNPRFGEMIKVSFGAYYSKSFLFDFCNSIIGTLTFSLIFILFKGRLPKKEWNDIICFSTLIVYALFDPIFKFGSVFYWTAGSLNYLLFWFLILSGTNLILLFWRNVVVSPLNLTKFKESFSYF